ncbi:MAG: DNA translocase FtsK 4TM domain-containing protein [Candidatus Moraniibacteriota bacterium]
MSKKTKENKDIREENQEKKIEFGLNLKNSVKRGIIVVLLFLFALIFTFGFFGAGGAFGIFLNKIAGIVFGWGKWLLPLALLLAMVILLFKKRTVIYVVKIAGLILAFFSLLGFFHIFYDQDILLEVAKNGEGGGYIGFLIAWSLIKLTGKIVGVIFLISFLAIGIMVAFNFSIVEILLDILKKLRKEKTVNSTEDNISNIEIEDKLNLEVASGDEENSQSDENEKTKKTDLELNIKNVQFIEDDSGSKREDEGESDGNGEESKEAEVDNIKNVSFDKIEKPSSKKKRKNTSSSNWILPSLTLLDDYDGEADGGNIEERIDIIKDAFANFGIELEFSGYITGPSVTQYSFRPAVGVKLSKIVSFGDDLSLALAAHPIRIEAPIPGKSLIGIEVPNKKPIKVRLKEALESEEFRKNNSKLALALGKNVEGKFVVADLGDMPHLLIAGATGTGKSVCVNSIILSLLFKNSPEDLKMILVDPKRVELSLYNKIPHLITDVITDNKKVVNALRWAVQEMERRYKLLESIGTRDLDSYNEEVENGLKRTVIDPDTGESTEEDLVKMPSIVIVIDELAELMMSQGKDVEVVIARLAQKARAVGIHLIISTQRPSANIITGIIKANITNKIALHVNNYIDSRTIIDTPGAEKLLGKGDLLFLGSSASKPVRLQNSFVSENEVKRVVNYIIDQEKQNQESKQDTKEDDFNTISLDKDEKSESDFNQVDFSIEGDGDTEDSLYEEVKEFVLEGRRASASLFQRKFRIGYTRAARLLDYLEKDGIVGPGEGAKPRDVLVDKNEGDIEESSSKSEEVTQEDRDKWQI